MPRSLEPRAQLLWYLIESGGFDEVIKKAKIVKIRVCGRFYKITKVSWGFYGGGVA